MGQFEDDLASSYIQANDATGDHYGDNFNGGVVEGKQGVDLQNSTNFQSDGMNEASQEAKERVIRRIQLPPIDPELQSRIQSTLGTEYPQTQRNYALDIGRSVLSPTMSLGVAKFTTPVASRLVGPGLGEIVGAGAGILGGALTSIAADWAWPKEAH